jgi:undecaprenyl-diphosphatase
MLQAFVLGLIQGLTEFLPISSSGHLVLVPWFSNWTDPGLGFSVALHWGTLVAVLFYFRNDVWLIIKGFVHSLFKSTRDLENNVYQKLSWLIILASIPAAIIGKLLEDYAESTFRNPILIAVTLSVFGLVLLLADVFGEKVKNLSHIKWLDALIVGFSQALALIPGVSRSGATMTAGLFLGFKRADAARFSFLMSIPVIFGAGLAHITHFNDGVTTGQLVVGFLAAAVSGFLSIKYLLSFLANRSFKVFVWYRFGLTAVIIAVYLLRQ